MFKSVLAVLLIAAAAASEVNPEPVSLVGGTNPGASAGDYAILAKSGISTAPQSAITGDIAVSPAATYITGFSLSADSTNTFPSSTQVVGEVKAANYAVPVPSDLTSAVSSMEAAYSATAGRTNPNAARVNLGTGNLGGNFGGAEAPLIRGVYTFTTDVNINSDIVFQGPGTGTDIFIIQITGNMRAVHNVKITLTNGALA